MARRRAVLLAFLAVVVPSAAFAIGNSGGNGPVALGVSTSVDSCGVAGTEVVCKLDVSYNSVPGADRYTATVTRADGSVVDYGSVAPGGASLWVPYVGPGSYSVRITAYGSPAEEGGRGNPIADETSEPAEATISGARGNNVASAGHPGNRVDEDAAATTDVKQTKSPGNDAHTDGASAAQADETSAPSAPDACAANPEPAPPTEGPINPPPPDTDPNNDDEDADGVSDAEELAAVAAGTPLHYPAESAEQPQSVECPAPRAAR